jgi:hypothetical protein
MTAEKYTRLKITTKKGLIFEIILEDWLKEGDYEFGKVELIETLDTEQRNDYVDVIKNLFDMGDFDMGDFDMSDDDE